MAPKSGGKCGVTHSGSCHDTMMLLVRPVRSAYCWAAARLSNGPYANGARVNTIQLSVSKRMIAVISMSPRFVGEILAATRSSTRLGDRVSACRSDVARNESAAVGQGRSTPRPMWDVRRRDGSLTIGRSWLVSPIVVGFRKSLGFLKTAHGCVVLCAAADDEEGPAFDRAHANAVRRLAVTNFGFVARAIRVPPMTARMEQRRLLGPREPARCFPSSLVFVVSDFFPFGTREPGQDARELGLELGESNRHELRQRVLEHGDERLDLGGVDFLSRLHLPPPPLRALMTSPLDPRATIPATRSCILQTPQAR